MTQGIPPVTVVALVLALVGPTHLEATDLHRGSDGPIGCSTWVQVPTSDLPENSYLTDVDGSAPNDQWAIGYVGIISYPPIFLHWDGRRWTPYIQRWKVGLTDIAVISSTDAWAVGGNVSTNRPLIEHWDGASWAPVPTPSPGGSMSGLSTVTVVSSTDMWAGGEQARGPLTEHWDGTAWEIVPAPRGVVLLDLSAVSSSDVWGVGFRDSINSRPTSIHWDGTSWTEIPAPSPPTSDYSQLHAVAAISTNDVWAVGDDFAGEVDAPFVEHWDGVRWTIVPTPTFQDNAYFEGISALSSDDIWAVGSILSVDYTKRHPLTEHWDGDAWEVVPSPSELYSYFNGVHAVSHTDIWAVGASVDPYPFGVPLIERARGPCS